MNKEIYEKSIKGGNAFELGFKWKFIKYLLECEEDSKKKERYMNEFEEIKIAFGPLSQGKYKEDNEFYGGLGVIACESYIDMLFKNRNKKFKPDFVGRLAEAEKEGITWENADLLFVQDDTLYVFELTLLGAEKILNRFKDPKRNRNKNGKIDLYLDITGPNIEVGYYKENLTEVVDDILKVFKNNNPLMIVVSEYMKLIQALSYVYSFLKEKKEYAPKIKKVFVSTIYPFYEGLKMFLKVDTLNEEILERQLNEITELRDRLKAEYEKIIDNKLNKILELENKKETIVIEPNKTIGEIREKVRDIVLTDDSMGNITALCHPAGTGKTTAILNKVFKDLEENNAVLLLYFVPRIKIADDKKKITLDRLKSDSHLIFPNTKDKESDDYYIVLSNDDVRQENEKNMDIKSEKFKDIFHQIDEEIQKGLLKTFHEMVYKKMEKEGKKYRFIGIFTTLQSIVNIESEKANTFKNAIFLARYLINKWKSLKSKDKDFNINKAKVYIVLDEILADNTGLYKLNIITKGLEKTFNKNEDPLKDYSKIYILDANFGSGKVLEDVLYKSQEYIRKGINFVPSSVFKVKGKDLNRESFTFYLDKEKFKLKEDWEVKAYGSPGFVGKRLTLTREIKFFKNKNEIIKKIAEKTKNEKEPCFVYIQDKEIARGVKDEIEKKSNKKVAIITSTMDNVDREKESYKDYDVVVATSSISRGVDVPFRKVYVYIYENSPVSEVAELYQALSRGRGIKDEEGNIIDDKIDREVTILFYKILPDKEKRKKVIKEIEVNVIDQIEKEFKEKIKKKIKKKEEDIYKAKKILQLTGFMELIKSNLEAYINPKDEKEYLISITETQQPNLSISYLTQLKELDEIAKIIMPKRNNKNNEIAKIVTYITNAELLSDIANVDLLSDIANAELSSDITNVELLSERKIPKVYPFALVETYKYVSIDINFLIDMLNILNKEEKTKKFNISKAKLNEYKNFINQILSFTETEIDKITNKERINIHIGREYAIEYLPARPFRNRIANQEFKLSGKYITRSGLAAISDVIKLSEKGDFVISITGGYMNINVFNPKVPIEAFMQKDLLFS